MDITEIKIEAAIGYAEDIMEGLSELASFSDENESKTILKVISAIQVMMIHDFDVDPKHRLDS